MPVVVLSERGQLVIPQEIRRKLDLAKGSRLHLGLMDDGQTITLRPVGRIKSLRGFLKGTPTADRMLAAVRREERQRDERRGQGVG